MLSLLPGSRGSRKNALTPEPSPTFRTGLIDLEVLRFIKVNQYFTAWATSFSRTKQSTRCRRIITSDTIYDKRFTGDTVGFPSEAIWYESVIAVPTFSKGKLVELKLYPIELNQKAPRSQRGTPRMAYGENAEKIIKRLAQLSEPLGIRIEFKDGIGVWVRK